MINFEPKGAIFDIDDTLLDNKPGSPEYGLHEKARLMAAREAGERHNIDSLRELSAEVNHQAYITAPANALDVVVWNLLCITGQVGSEVMDANNSLLKEIVVRKNELYEGILRSEGEAVPGATRFVRRLAASGMESRLAVASASIRRDVDIFLDKAGLKKLFPDDKIKTRESITHAKPNPEVFNLAFNSLELPESARKFVCAFEDDPRGIMAARAAGLFVCAIGTRYTPSQIMQFEVPPHVAFTTYDEFTRWFDLGE
jgi:beta-phosphoglucomutase-like phosphatase (HAD superfamily)